MLSLFFAQPPEKQTMSPIFNDACLQNVPEDMDEEQSGTRYQKHQEPNCAVYEYNCGMDNEWKFTSEDVIR